MLKGAIYLNVVILFVASIILLKKISKNDTDLKSLKKLIIFYLLLDIIDIYSFSLVDVGWNGVIIFPTFVISWILYVIGICRVNKKIELKSNTSIVKEGYGLNFLGKNYAKYISSLDTETILVPDEENNGGPPSGKDAKDALEAKGKDGIEYTIMNWNYDDISKDQMIDMAKQVIDK